MFDLVIGFAAGAVTAVVVPAVYNWVKAKVTKVEAAAAADVKKL